MPNIILMYHNIAEHGQCILFQEWSPEYNVSSTAFFEHLKVIGNCQNNVVLTFDDGYQSTHKFILPVREKFPALQCKCFISTAFINCSGMLSKNEIRELAKTSVGIGAHSHTHVFLDKLSDRQLQEEILQPKDILEEITGTEITEMSLPGGRYDSRSLEFAAQCGYKKIYTSKPGMQPSSFSKSSGIERVPRWAINATTMLKDIDRIVNIEYPYITLQKTQYLIGKLAKQLLGNRSYHALWQRLK